MKCVDINFDPSKLNVCNDELWVGGRDKGVLVYNLDLGETRHVEHPQLKNVTGALKTPEGVIVCDGSTGVHHLNHQGDYTSLICSGCFSDASLTGDNKLYVLQCEQGEIHTFVRNQNSWVKDIQFKLLHYINGCDCDKLCITSEHVYVSACNNHCVLVYTLSGEFVYKTGGWGGEVGKFDRPLLSGVYSGGKLLVCDCWNNRVQLFDTQSKEYLKLSGLEGARRPVCAGVGDQYLWVGKRDKLFKFEIIY